jgi:hypothetical protein
VGGRGVCSRVRYTVDNECVCVYICAITLRFDEFVYCVHGLLVRAHTHMRICRLCTTKFYAEILVGVDINNVCLYWLGGRCVRVCIYGDRVC